MADNLTMNESQAIHLTNVDLDIQGVVSSINQAEKLLQESANKVGTGEQYKYKLQATVQDTTKNIEGINNTTKAYETQANAIQQAVKQEENLIQTRTKTTSEGQFISSSKTYEDDYTKIVNIVDENEKIITSEIINEISKRETARQKESDAIESEYQKQLKSLDNYIYKQQQSYKTITAQPQNVLPQDYELATKEVENLNAKIVELNTLRNKVSTQNTFSDEDIAKANQLQKEIDDINIALKTAEQSQKNFTSQTKSLDSLINKYKDFQATLKSQATSTQNVSILNDVNSNLIELEKIKKSASETQTFSADDLTNIDKYKTGITDLNRQFKETGNGANNFLQTITDKARWLLAFYFITLIKDGFFALIDTIKSTEDAVIDLQRVLSQDLDASVISDELYQIAQDYGRSFEEVSDTATKFAQAGYEWAEVTKLVESTMLALNTAELEVTTATTGLIAVLQQFGIEAYDIETVIDQINVTADNFAVTSENIVAALQRAGGTAKTANLSLEDTIATITTLSEATGRSGENIGTALNSLINYTQQADALDVFANLSDSLNQTVTDYKSGAASIIDVWKQLSVDVANLSSEQQQLLFSSDSYQALADELEMQSTEITDTVKEVYGTAGVYRQNYFVALLNNFGTYEEVMQNMIGAEGYSLTENEKYMESLTASYNTLIAKVKELAVNFGNSGFLEFLKTLTDIASGSIDVLNAIGGLQTGLLLLVQVMIAFKAQDIKNVLSGISSSMITATKNFTGYINNVKSATTVSQKFSTATTGIGNGIKGLITSMGGWLAIVNLLVIAFSAITGAIEEYNRKQEELMRLASENAIETQNEVKSLIELREEYEKAMHATTSEADRKYQLESISATLAQTYGVEKDRLDALNQSRQDGIDLINEETEAIYNNWIAESGDEYRKAVEKVTQGGLLQNGFFETLGSGLFVDYDLGNLTGNISATQIYLEDTNEGILNLLKGFEQSGKYVTATSDNALDSLKLIDENIILLEKEFHNLTNEEKNFLELLRYAQEEYNKFLGENTADVFEKGTEIYSEMAFLDFQPQIENLTQLRELISTLPLSESGDEIALYNEQWQELYKNAENQEYINEYVKQSVLDLITTYKDLTDVLPETIDGLEVLTLNLEAFAERAEAINNSVDGMQSSMTALTEATTQYNEYGRYSIDTIQQLATLGVEYQQAMFYSAEGVSLLDGQTQNLIKSERDLVKELIKQQTAAGLSQIANKYLKDEMVQLESEAQTASSEIGSLGDESLIVAGELLTTAKSANTLRNELSLFATGIGVPELNLTGFTNEASAYIRTMQGLYNEVDRAFDTENIDGQNSVLQNNIDLQKEANEVAIDGLEKQKELLEEQHNTFIADKEKEISKIEEKYNTEIDKLREVEEENDRIRQKEQYELDKLRNAQDLTEVQARSGVEYREQETDLLNEGLELERNWIDQLEDWAIADKVAELELARDTEIALIEADILAKEELYTQELEALENQIELLNQSNDLLSESLSSTANDIYESGSYLVTSVYDIANTIDLANANLLETAKQYQVSFLELEQLYRAQTPLWTGERQTFNSQSTNQMYVAMQGPNYNNNSINDFFGLGNSPW